MRLAAALCCLAAVAGAVQVLPPPPTYPGQVAVTVQQAAATQALPLVATLIAAHLDSVTALPGRVATVVASVGASVPAGGVLATLADGKILIAPVGGTLVWMRLVPQTRLHAGELVARIASGGIVLRASVPQALSWELPIMAAALVVVPALGPLPLQATVAGPKESGAVILDFVGGAPQGAMPGMGAVVQAPAATSFGRMLVPVSAVHGLPGNAPYVWRVSRSGLQRVTVHIAWRHGTAAAVGTGLTAGQRVLMPVR